MTFIFPFRNSLRPYLNFLPPHEPAVQAQAALARRQKHINRERAKIWHVASYSGVLIFSAPTVEF